MPDVALINPPRQSLMVDKLQRRARERVAAAETHLMKERHPTYEAYIEAYARAEMARCMEDDLIKITDEFLNQ